jgi:hypothetical protein
MQSKHLKQAWSRPVVRLAAALVITLVALAARSGAASAAPLTADPVGCEAAGGIWTEHIPGLFGECFYFAGPGDPTFDAFCNPAVHNGFTVLWLNDPIGGWGPLVFGGCGRLSTGAGVGGGLVVYPGYGPFGKDLTGPEEETELSLKKARNGTVTFQSGACPQKCTISNNLPAGAKNSLPGDTVATLYVRVTAEGSEPGNGSYTACFNVGDLSNPVIYKYVGGQWVAVAATTYNGQICTTASGDGAFALGGG